MPLMYKTGINSYASKIGKGTLRSTALTDFIASLCKLEVKAQLSQRCSW